MKIENLEIKTIKRVDSKTKKGEIIKHSMVLENKDYSVTITSQDPFGMDVDQKGLDLELKNGQKKLTDLEMPKDIEKKETEVEDDMTDAEMEEIEEIPDIVDVIDEEEDE